MFSLNIGLTQKKEVRKLSKERGNWKKFDSRLDWKKDYTPRKNIIGYFVLKFKVEMWQGLENSLPEIKWQNSCKENFFLSLQANILPFEGELYKNSWKSTNFKNFI